MNEFSTISTGLPSLDRIIRELQPGDNVVWQVDSIADYKAFVKPFYKHVLFQHGKLIYLRFARHEELVPLEQGVCIYQLSPQEGFEAFITQVHEIIERHGGDGNYVFDSLSELAIDCFSDRMVGNFFMLTCPYLKDIGAIAYFAVLRNYHSFHAATPIAETTQVLFDVYHHKDELYLQPVKVSDRYSQTMNRLYVWRNGELLTVTQSAAIAEVLTSVPWGGFESAIYQMGVWNRVFLQAEEALEAYRRQECNQEKIDQISQRLLTMVISRDERVLRLARQYFSLSDLIAIRKRMIGTGWIGGKAVGMLLARAILRRNQPRWQSVLEEHDSFYIGSEVFYTYLVLNDCWWVRKKQKDRASFLQYTDEAQHRILAGQFPDYIVKRFERLLDYFGQSPLVVRSSSLLEDNFGNTFAGKYETVFCTNQGSRSERLDSFMNAVRKIYASSMSEKALTYRARRGLLDQDEQMALLVQRVSGQQYGDYFYPHLSGVGYSFNSYAWSNAIDPAAGVVRLVFGLGTRAVERTDDDFSRLVALNAPLLRPETGAEEIRSYSQKKVDVLDLRENRIATLPQADVLSHSPGLPYDYVSCIDEELERMKRDTGLKEISTSIVSFDRAFTETNFIKDIREMLQTLQQAYSHPVDIEFAANLTEPKRFSIHLLQCRPMQVLSDLAAADPPAHVPRESILVESHGAVIGQSRAATIDRIIYVVPEVYGNLPYHERYSVARVIGQLIRSQVPNKRDKTVLLMGPGRWGTTTPSLGVPVSFMEISNVSFLCEIEAMRDDFVPDVSFGTHFFSNLVELEIVYFAVYPKRDGNYLNHEFLCRVPNQLCEILPTAEKLSDCIRAFDLNHFGDNRRVKIFTNSIAQRVLCYSETD